MAAGGFLAEVNCAWPLHNFLGHDEATFALPQQKEHVIGLHGGAVSKPAEAAVWDDLMRLAPTPLKVRASLVEFDRAV
jgi:hypothetical protein